MEFKRFRNKFVVRLDKGEEIVASIKRLCKENKITLGSVSGIGAVDHAVIGLFETGTKTYHTKKLTGDMEITCLAGNITEMEGEVYLHFHITLTDHTYQALGGHLTSAVISGTAEIIVDVIEGSVDRAFSEEIGLNLLKF
ncbi:MAG: PPC domain-containing DNA-binding protein [Bacillota bacterium]